MLQTYTAFTTCPRWRCPVGAGANRVRHVGGRCVASRARSAAWSASVEVAGTRANLRLARHRHNAHAPSPMTYDKAYFDKWYRSRTHRVRTPAQIRRIVAFTLSAAEYVLDRPVRTVLDVGAGEGHWQPMLAAVRPNLRYIGVEPSEYAVQRFGRRRGLRLGTVERLADLGLHETHPEGFDLVICCGVLNYLPSKQIAGVLEQLRLHTSGLAWLELFTKDDEIEGDVATMRPKPPAWYGARLAAAGFVPCGLHLYAPRDLAIGLAALETGERS